MGRGANWADPDVVSAFCAAWNGAASIDAMSVQFNLSNKSVMSRASILRRAGYELQRRAGTTGGKDAPATVMVVFSVDQRAVLAAAIAERATSGYRLINDVVAALLDDPVLLDNVLDDGVTTPDIGGGA